MRQNVILFISLLKGLHDKRSLHIFECDSLVSGKSVFCRTPYGLYTNKSYLLASALASAALANFNNTVFWILGNPGVLLHTLFLIAKNRVLKLKVLVELLRTADREETDLVLSDAVKSQQQIV